MEVTRLPRRLKKEPLIDAVFELRFASTMAASAVLPGLLYQSLGRGAQLQLVRLPQAELPQRVRDADQNLRFAPLVQLHWGQFVVFVGDRTIGLGCRMPYPGWNAFSEAISKVIAVIGETDLVGMVQRYSIKYVDLLPRNDIRMQVEGLDLQLKIGLHTLVAESAHIRVEMVREDAVHIVQVITGAQAEEVGKQEVRNGAVVDVDSVVNLNNLQMRQFIAEIKPRLDKLHTANKRLFFECLTHDMLNELEPEYE